MNLSKRRLSIPMWRCGTPSPNIGRKRLKRQKASRNIPNRRELGRENQALRVFPLALIKIPGFQEKRRAQQKGGIPTPKLKLIILSAAFLFCLMGTASASGLWGPPQSVSRGTGGLHTGIGYGYSEDQYENDTVHTLRQNQVYSHLGYGARHWDIYRRIGISDLKIPDASRSTQGSTTTCKNDFKDKWMFFGTLGAKGFYPFNKTFGMGVFAQASHFFSDFPDEVFGDQNGVPFTAELKVKDFWDVNFGFGLQATVPKDIKIYIGSYLYHSEAKTSPSPNISALELLSKDRTIKTKGFAGGFAGVDLPIGKGFHLNVEGKYSKRFSAGAVITNSY